MGQKINFKCVARAAGLGMLLGSACAPEYAGVVLNISYMPKNVTRIVVSPIVDNKTLPREIFDKDILGKTEIQIGLRLPRNALGSKLSLTIDAQTDQYCTAATGSTIIAIDDISRYEQFVSLKQTTSESIMFDLLAVYGSAANDVWVAGANGSTAHWDGCGWKASPVLASATNGPPVSRLYVPPRPAGADPGDANTAFAIVDPGVVRQWDGTQWQPAISPPSGKLSAIHGSSRQNIWAVGEAAAGGCILYRYNGDSWISGTYCQGTPNTYMRAVHVLSETEAYVGGTEGGLPVVAKFNVSMNKWEKMIFSQPYSNPMDRATPGNFSAVYASQVIQSGNVWVGGELNTLQFNDATGGLFRLRPEFASAVTAVAGTVDKPFGIFAISGTSASDIWVLSANRPAATTKTYVFHLVGNTWQYEAALDKYVIYGVWANSPTDVWFVGQGGVRLRYNGQTYTPVG